jgi:hypothetical protein
MVMLTDGVKAADRGEDVQALDIAEVVLASPGHATTSTVDSRPLTVENSGHRRKSCLGMIVCLDEAASSRASA